MTPSLDTNLTIVDDGKNTREHTLGNVHFFSPRELQVMRLVARGLTNKEVAIELGIAASTVGHFMNRLFLKTGTHNRTQLAISAIEEDEAVRSKDHPSGDERKTLPYAHDRDQNAVSIHQSERDLPRPPVLPSQIQRSPQCDPSATQTQPLKDSHGVKPINAASSKPVPNAENGCRARRRAPGADEAEPNSAVVRRGRPKLGTKR